MKSDGEVKTPKHLLYQIATSRPASWLLLCALFWMVAAGSHSGFVGKWGLRDKSSQFGIESMLDATAHKPFVYRQFAPIIANYIEKLTPDKWRIYTTSKFKIRPDKTFTKASSAGKPEFVFRYLIVYYLSFSSLFLSLFVLRMILLDAGVGKSASVYAPISFMIAFPYLQTIGGYYYDCIEILFLSLAFLLATRGKFLWLILIVLPATINKESFFFFLPTLFPLIRRNLNLKKAMIVTLLAILVAGLINIVFKILFIDAPGSVAVVQVLKNLQNYLMPGSYLKPEITFGIIGPKGVFAGTLAILLIIVSRGWPHCSHEIRCHLIISAVINFPLFFALCATGELRNLSLMYVGFVVLVAFAIERGSVHGSD